MERKARAKINLSLDVVNKRPDGYHNVAMVMQTVDLYDDVTVEHRESGITIETNLSFLPTDAGNIAHKAATLFFEEAGLSGQGVYINIFKRIPVAAGLAGGSANAAAVLLLMNDLFKTGFTLEKLMEMGLKLGADVPYCLTGGTMLAEGIGEELTRLAPMQACTVVLCKPPFSVSTAMVYAKIQPSKIHKRPDTTGLLAAIKEGQYVDICRRMYNVMEDVTSLMHKEIGQIKKLLLDRGADGAIMSGSGPTMFGLFLNEADAQSAYEALAALYKETHICRISSEFLTKS